MVDVTRRLLLFGAAATVATLSTSQALGSRFANLDITDFVPMPFRGTTVGNLNRVISHLFTGPMASDPIGPDRVVSIKLWRNDDEPVFQTAMNHRGFFYWSAPEPEYQIRVRESDVMKLLMEGNVDDRIIDLTVRDDDGWAYLERHHFPAGKVERWPLDQECPEEYEYFTGAER